MQLVCNLLLQTQKELKGVKEEIKCMRNEMKNVIRESVSTNLTSVVKDSQIQALTQKVEKAEKKLAYLRTPPSPQKLPPSPLHHSSVEELQSSEPHLSDDDLKLSSTMAASDMAIQIPQLSLRNSDGR
jgi:hypothetical protein